MEVVSQRDVTCSPWKEARKALIRLDIQGMSSDETDSELPEKRVRRVQLAFLNREFTALFAQLDALPRDGKAIKKDQRGNRVLLRIHDSYKVDHLRVVHGLPRNWYDPDWWRSLPSWEQSSLNAIAPAPIPTLDS